MNKYGKKLTSLLLAVIMLAGLFALMPTMASADDGQVIILNHYGYPQPFNRLTDAINAILAGNVNPMRIQLLQDISIDSLSIVNKKVIFELGPYNLEITNLVVDTYYSNNSYVSSVDYTCSTGTFTVGKVSVSASNVTVQDVTVWFNQDCGIYAEYDADVIVKGNVLSYSTVNIPVNVIAWAYYDSTIRIDGTVTIDSGYYDRPNYVRLGRGEFFSNIGVLSRSQYTLPTTKTGYLTYTIDDDDSTIWIKGTPVPTLKSLMYTIPKTQYIQGETLDLSGMVVTALYDDGSTKNVTGNVVTNFAHGMLLNEIGTFVVWVSYMENGITERFSFEIDVYARLEKIEVTILPDKMDYIEGEALDLTGMVVTAYYTDGSTYNPSENPGAAFKYTTHPENGTILNTVGSQTVTISYTEYGVTRTAAIIVTVAPAHVHDYTYRAVSFAPNCTEKGRIDYYCECGEFGYSEEISALGHKLDTAGVETLAPTCTAPGVRTFYCERYAVCGYCETEPIAALGHTPGDRIVTKEPTRTEKGEWEIYCVVCGALVESGEIDELGIGDVTSNIDCFASIRETYKGSGIWEVTFTVTITLIDADGNIVGTEVVEYYIYLIGNNGNLSGSYTFDDDHDLAGYTLVYDIKGNGSNIKAFYIIKN